MTGNNETTEEKSHAIVGSVEERPTARMVCGQEDASYRAFDPSGFDYCPVCGDPLGSHSAPEGRGSAGLGRLREPDGYWEVLGSAAEAFDDWEHLNKLVQEPAELIAAATDWDSGRAGEGELVDELVDTKQVVDGFVLLLGAEGEFEERLVHKSSRLAARAEARELMREKAEGDHINE